ncbi:MAG: metal-dependent transcriptional regulator [Deltaproteobacteria bacterium]|jgi:DtxR family Mn-dependent transcriptional regulator|nr:metal-dependent transcriptional regulator [Deltaproteobacteria bacterium]
MYNNDTNIDEILESLWECEEKEGSLVTLDKIQNICKIQIHHSLLNKMVSLDLINLDKDKISFTKKGRKRGRLIIRRHRLTDVLLFHILGYREHSRREKIACETEHNLQPEMVEGICTLLGHPSISPDGEKIPPGSCCLEKRGKFEATIVDLTRLSPGESGTIAYLLPTSHQKFDKLTSFGLLPGTSLTLIQKKPAYVIISDNTEIALDKASASEIYLSKNEENTIEPNSDKMKDKTKNLSFFSRLKARFFKNFS